MQQIVEGSRAIAQGTLLDPVQIAEGAGVELLDRGTQVDGGVSIGTDQSDFLKRHPAYIDAVVIVEQPDVHDDPTRAHGRDRRLPRKLSTHCIDDDIDPPLTTIRVPAAEMGRRAAEYLLARLDKTPIPEKTELQAALIVRETTAPPPK